MADKTPNPIMRAVIDSTVDRMLRQIDEDPKRSIRKMADFGRQFAKGRFMDPVYAMMQDLLRNDESPYYTAIENILRNTDLKALKDFGINFGYNSLTIGGSVIRSNLAVKDYYIPFAATVRLNSTVPNSISISEIDNCISQGIPLGLYVYSIRIEGPVAEPQKLRQLFQKHSDCAFLCFLPDENLSQEMLQVIKASTNVMVLCKAGSISAQVNTEFLRHEKILYGIYDFYNDDTVPDVLNGKVLDRISEYKSGFAVLISDESCSTKNGHRIAKYCYDVRLHPKHPLIVFDLVGDVMSISHIISKDDCCYFELLANGDIRNADEKISAFRHTISLEQLLAIANPKK